MNNSNSTWKLRLLQKQIWTGSKIRKYEKEIFWSEGPLVQGRRLAWAEERPSQQGTQESTGELGLQGHSQSGKPGCLRQSIPEEVLFSCMDCYGGGGVGSGGWKWRSWHMITQQIPRVEIWGKRGHISACVRKACSCRFSKWMKGRTRWSAEGKNYWQSWSEEYQEQ